MRKEVGGSQMLTMWKYPLEVTDTQWLSDVPLPAEVMSVGLDPEGQMCVWVMVDPDQSQRKNVSVTITGTGNPISNIFTPKFVGSVTVGKFVWHVWVWVNG
jgi:hypothetical protein